jgi:type IX secretion system PorP/SprF family membrane protein
MNQIYRILLVTAVLVLSSRLSAQQYPLFTNYILNQYGFNPATAGLTGDVQLNMYYRHQWTGFPDAPVTRIAAVRTRLKRVPFGVGGYFFNDEAGSLRRAGANGLLSYRQVVGERTAISVGFSAGYHQLRLVDGFTVRDDQDQVVADARLGSWSPDFNAGVYVESGDFYVGFSIPQLFAPKLRFGGNATLSRLNTHYYLVSGYHIGLGEEFRLEPSVMMKLTDENIFQVDGSLRGVFRNRFWLGGLYRSGDAMAAMAGFSVGKVFDVAYAYDFTTSGLRQVSSGSHEVSLTFRFGSYQDTDGDGVADKDDRCPDIVGSRRNEGCPVAMKGDGNARDSDGDGVTDDKDFCPNLAGPVTNNGCPLGDRDGDGIPDDQDACPGLPGVAMNRGCPVNDRDGDGIVDKFDECPDEFGSFDNRGCPDKDTDKDGTPDHLDQCPRTFGPPMNYGCPVVTTDETTLLQLAMQSLFYESAQTEIWDKSRQYLDRLANLMQLRSDWRLRIVGHADNRGTDRTNLQLSKDRAEAVALYLTNRGVRTEQLIVEYYGHKRPFSDNDTEAGRQLNRRVELEFVFE